MATVSTKCNGTYGSHYTLYLEYSLNSQDYKNNCSNITVSMYGKSDSTSYKAYNTSAVNPVSLSVEGSTKVSKNISMDFRNKKTVSMASWTGNVYHNSRGELSVDLAGSFSIKGVSSLRGGSISRSWTLPTIPRESSVTCTDGNIGSSVTVNINRASSSFSHTITYNFQGLTGTIATKTGNTSIGWTLPTSFFAKIPNSKSASGTIKCETYDGSTYIGSSTCRFNAFVSNSEPTISATVEDVNATTIALTGNKNKLIKYFSNAQVDIIATAKNSATISSRQVVCGGKTGTSASNTLNGVESGTFDISCTDSRGFTANTTVTKTLVEYVKLAFTDLTLARPTTTSNTVNMSLKGNYFNTSFGSVANTLALKYRYRVSDGTWNGYTTLTPTKSGNTYSLNKSLGDIYDFNNSYEFEFVATDKLMTITNTVIVSRGIPIIDIGKDDIVINSYINFMEQTMMKNDIKRTNTFYSAKRTDTDTEVNFGIGVSGINRGVYDTKFDKWMIYSDNSKTYVNEIPIDRVVAYSNGSGTTGTITLSYDASKYNHMRVSYKFNGNEYCSNTFSDVGYVGGYYWVGITQTASSDEYTYARSCLINVNGKTITLQRNRSTGFSKTDNDIYTPGGDNNLYITKVELWN